MTTVKVALVTGAGTGIGRAVSLHLAKAGYQVCLAGRRADKLEETKSLGGDHADRLHPMPTDVADETSINATFELIKQKFGRLDVLFNNAGRGGPPVPIEDLPTDVWRDIVNINLTGMFLCAQAAIRLMKSQSPQGGRIINNGSISAHTPRPFSIGYTATKHAVTGLTKSISLDTRQYNIACGQIDIGNAETPMTERMTQGVLQPDGSVRAEPRMDVNHVAESIVQMVGFPLETNVQFMTIMARTMPFIGRG